MTGYTNKVLDEVRAKLAPSDAVLKLARDRRALVLNAAMKFPGTLRKYNSGSIAHGTANSDLDADCGVVLDRRTYPQLGPDGDGVGPTAVVAQVVELVNEAVTTAEISTSKRAITIKFNAPVNGCDPSVDLIVGLERRDEPGLWIPQLFTNTWDASHPEKHTDLFTSGSAALRRVRARAVRLAKGWNGQFDEPGLSSFNIEALAWVRVTEDMSEADALAEIFAFCARELVLGPTPDPADVSPPIKLLLDSAIVVTRLNEASKLMQDALEHDDDENAVREALASLFPDYVDAPSASSEKAAMAAALREKGNSAFKVGRTGLEASAGAAGLKNVRSWSDEQGR
jgi:hypothetical protein